MNEKIKTSGMDELFAALTMLRTPEEASDFLEDICTIKEMQALAQRLWVARLLWRGEQYAEIVKATGASTATISRVNRCILYGSGGYKRVLERLYPDRENRK
jgi:TrpR-related protein YerC/YecD